MKHPNRPLPKTAKNARHPQKTNGREQCNTPIPIDLLRPPPPPRRRLPQGGGWGQKQ